MISLPIKLEGKVTRFKGNGRKLGYPTANLKIDPDLEDGVYFGLADLAEWSNRPSLIFIGTPTTVGDRTRRVEAHLLDIPDENYYGQPLKLEVAVYHRPNRHFENIDELVLAMKTDEATARQWFSKRT